MNACGVTPSNLKTLNEQEELPLKTSVSVVSRCVSEHLEEREREREEDRDGFTNF